jgi:NitT/TauT family transport system ATP-binding protein
MADPLSPDRPNPDPLTPGPQDDDADHFVALDDVSLRYGGEEDGTLALEHATLHVRQGEFAAVIGPSGCGKSTLMKAVSGLWPVSAGEVHVAGAPVTGPLSVVGMAFQSATLLPWRTTLDNVMLPLEIAQPHRSRLRANRAEYEARARDLLALVGLAGFEAKHPWELSGGMQQRVSLCRALIHEPRLLILDEPFAALDMFTREELWGVVQDIWLERRPTILLVTHDLREAVFLADRVHVMSARPGRITHRTDIPFARGPGRPRRLDITFTPEFGALAQGLRDRIDDARSAAPPAQAAAA